ncbi:MAG: phage tail tape measure protein, partial [Psychrilyobacter sp.]|uniref:phage tail tape measure protein n=1 Tax=Psychrilyobacter sp. TaxID=2586924 RepID=UPI003C7730C9
MKRMMPPALMIGVGVKLAIDDEAAFADVKKQLSITDPTEIKKFRKELLNTTKDIPLMNSEIYAIAAAAGQAGIEQKELAKFTADTSKVAVAFGVDAGKAGSNLATWRTSLKMTQSEVMGLADQINTLGDNIKVTPAQVSDIVTAMGPLGKMANVTVSQTAALGASLIDFGVKDASTASTALRKLYSTMSSGDSASKSRKEAFEALGFDSGQIARDMQKDSMGTIKKVLGAFKNVDKSKRMSIGTMLFGEEAVGALLPLSNQLGKLQNNLDMINNKKKVANSVNKEFNNVNSTASAQLKIFGKSLLNLGLAFTNFLLPPLKVLTKLFTKGSQIITGFAQKFPGLTEFLTLTVTGFVGVNLALGAATFGVGALGTAFTALMSNPILLILAAVAAGGYLIYKNFDKIESKTIELWNGFKINIGKVKDKTLELWDVFEKSPIFKVFEYSPLGMFLKGIKRIYSWYKKFKGEKTKELPSLQQIKTSKLIDQPLQNKSLRKDKSNSVLSGNWNEKKKNSRVPAYAKGGVVSNPHLALVGDGPTPESIIPHDGSKQSKSLWYDAGAKLGMFAGKGIPSLTSNVEEKLSKTNIENKIEIKIDYNPTIQGSIDNITEILKNSSEDLAKIVEEIVEKTISK